MSECERGRERERERKEEGKPGLGDKFEMRYIKIKGVRYRSFCPLQPCKIGGRAAGMAQGGRVTTVGEQRQTFTTGGRSVCWLTWGAIKYPE